MAEAAGKFQLIDGDDDKMDAILAEMGKTGFSHIQPH